MAISQNSAFDLQRYINRRTASDRSSSLRDRAYDRDANQQIQQDAEQEQERSMREELNRRRAGIEEEYTKSRMEAIKGTPIEQSEPPTERAAYTDDSGKTTWKIQGAKPPAGQQDSIRARQGKLAQLDAAKKQAYGEKIPLTMRELISQQQGGEAQRSIADYKKQLLDDGFQPDEVERMVGEKQRELFNQGVGLRSGVSEGTGKPTGVFQIPASPVGSVGEWLTSARAGKQKEMQGEQGLRDVLRQNGPLTAEELQAYQATVNPILDKMDPEDRQKVEALLTQLGSPQTRRKDMQPVLNALNTYLNKYQGVQVQDRKVEQTDEKLNFQKDQAERKMQQVTLAAQEKARQFDTRMTAQREASERNTPLANQMLETYRDKDEIDGMLQELNSTGAVPEKLRSQGITDPNDAMEALLEAQREQAAEMNNIQQTWDRFHPQREQGMSTSDFESIYKQLLTNKVMSGGDPVVTDDEVVQAWQRRQKALGR